MQKLHAQALVLVCLLAAAIVVGCGSSSKAEGAQSTFRNTRLGIVVVGRSLPTKMRIRRAGGIRSPLPHLAHLSHIFEIDPSGPLVAPVAISFPLTRSVPRGDVVIVATSESRHAPWKTLRGELLAGRRRVLIHVQHFSFFTGFLLDVKSTLSAIKTTVLDGLTSDFDAQAKPPTCGDEAGARRDGYAIASDSKDTVYWCFGLEHGQRVLRVVNNRRYPLEVDHPGLTVADAGSVHIDLMSLSRAVSGKETIIFPRDTVSFALDLDPGTRAGISTQLDGLGQSLYQLQQGISAAVDALDRLGIRAQGTQLLKTAVESGECASALGGTPGDMFSKCLPSLLKTAYGTKGALAAAAIQIGSLAAFFRSEANAMFDQLNSRDSYRIVIGRAKQQPAPAAPKTTSTVEAAPAPTTTEGQAPPTDTTAAGATTQSLGNVVGKTFDDECVVAWPTAPRRTSTQIEMTMQCSHLPQPYILAEVIYRDPNLAIQPSMQVHVHGKVVDTLRSDMGLQELVVEADRIDLPNG